MESDTLFGMSFLQALQFPPTAICKRLKGYEIGCAIKRLRVRHEIRIKKSHKAVYIVLENGKVWFPVTSHRQTLPRRLSCNDMISIAGNVLIVDVKMSVRITSNILQNQLVKI